MVKLLSAIVFLFFASQGVNAQNLQIKVVSDGEPLGFSYIHINDRIYCAVDSMGTAVIPRSELSLGDTLSASFIGYRGEPVIYRGRLLETPSHTFLLKSAFDAGEVVVRADWDKFFRKNVMFPNPDWNGNRFNIRFRYSSHDDYPDFKDGRVSLFIYANEQGKFASFVLDYQAGQDSSEMMYFINTSIINAAAYSVVNIMSTHFGRFGRIGYLGEEGPDRIFTISYEVEGQMTFQQIIYVDKNTRKVRRAEMTPYIKDGYYTTLVEYDNTRGRVLRVRNTGTTFYNTETGRRFYVDLPEIEIVPLKRSDIKKHLKTLQTNGNDTP